MITPEDRIAILERAVSDLQRELREYHGYAPPAGADMLDHTPLDAIGLRDHYVETLVLNGITSVERLVAYVNGDWLKLMRLKSGRIPFAPADVRQIEKEVKAANLQPTE